MALLQVDFLSKALSRIVTVHAYLPNDVQEEFKTKNPNYDRPTKCLYLLHGFSGNSTDWVTGSNAMDISRKYNLAIIMPSGENSFYIDRKGTGNAYETFIAKELREFVCASFCLSNQKQDTFIGGLSMGGFGALRLGVKYPQIFGGVFGLSSAMIIHDIAGLKRKDLENMPVQIADYDYYENTFGDLSRIEDSDVNPEYIIKQKVASGEALPRIYMACGTEDILLEQNRAFRDFLEAMAIEATYCESKGAHDWQFWSQYLEPAVQWLLAEAPKKAPLMDIPFGDMPGDKIDIQPSHIEKAKRVYGTLKSMISKALEESAHSKVVLTVCGGSGVGKSEVASLLAHYLSEDGMGTYTLSGDNYPKRIPMYNDAERLRVFRSCGMKALAKKGFIHDDVMMTIRALQREGEDANRAYLETYEWFETYLNGGISGLEAYLGTQNEIDFDDLSDIIHAFKSGEKHISLKRMGRTDSELWYSRVDFSNTPVLIVEWTHGNSDYLKGVDIPIFLNSTPEETLEHRKARNRDGKTDSTFTMRVLEIEQKLLEQQAHKARIIVSKKGDVEILREVTNENR